MLDGNGDAAGVTFAGADTELGDLNAGTLIVSNAATLTLGGGASVAAATAMDSGTIFAFDGFAQFGNLTFDPDFLDTATVAATGTIEIGNAGSAVAGALTVDQGYTMSGPVSLPGNVVRQRPDRRKLPGNRPVSRCRVRIPLSRASVSEPARAVRNGHD